MNFRKMILGEFLVVNLLIVLTAILFPAQIIAEESITANTDIVNPVQILEPEYYNLEIEYTYQNTMGYIIHNTTGRLIGLVDTPRFQKTGPTTFWGDDVASQVITISFQGRWLLQGSGSDRYSDIVAVGEVEWTGPCSLSFALNEDGSRWRLFSGTLPALWAFPDEEVRVDAGFHGICLGAGTLSGPEPGLINKLIYDYRHTDPDPPPLMQAYHQGLSTSERVSEYPNFMLTAGYEFVNQYANLDPDFIIFGAVISLQSGLYDDGE